MAWRRSKKHLENAATLQAALQEEEERLSPDEGALHEPTPGPDTNSQARSRKHAAEDSSQAAISDDEDDTNVSVEEVPHMSGRHTKAQEAGHDRGAAGWSVPEGSQ